MSSIGVVVFRNSVLGNAQVLQQTVNNAANISNNDKKPKRDIIIVRKKQKIQPQPTVSVTSLVRAAEGVTPARALKRPRPRDSPTEDGKTPTPPVAVARRNARERNRVRQVNNGFAALRRHIPEEVAEAFETANSNRGPNKKLSKVETLRMAVEYIRNLESLLNIGESSNKENSRIVMDSFPSPASSSPRDNSLERSYFSLHSPALDDDEDDEEGERLLSSSVQHHYARLPADNFHLTGASHLYEEEENGQPLTPGSDLIATEDLMSPQLLDANFHFMNSAEHFTVIHPDQNFGSEADVAYDDGASEMDVKYAETLRLSEIQPHMLTDEAVLNSLNTVDPQLILPQDQYRFREEDIPASVVETDDSEDMQLKRELPDIHVSPEDRQQFEETLKWWQEKTKISHSVLVGSENIG